MSNRRSLFGTMFTAPRSTSTTVVVEPTLGFRADQPAQDLSPGQTPYSLNYIMRDGALEPRPRLSQVTTSPNPLGVPVTGGMEVVSSNGSYYPLISGTTRPAFYSNGSWSAASFVSSGGVTAVAPSGSTTDYWDFTQIYLPRIDDNIAIAGTGSYETLLCWRSGTTIFSRLTQAPRAKYVATHDNFVIAGNIKDSSGSRYIQRYQTSARGDPETWIGNVQNFSEDLLEARGEMTRIIAHESRVVFFFEREIYVAYRSDYPAIYKSQSLDKNVGTTLSWTICVTPVGIIFLGNDFMLYLLPKEGGPAQPIGQAVQKTLRDTMNNPTLSHAVYDDSLASYRLFYDVRNGAGVPTEELTLHIPTMTVAPQSYGRGITKAFPAYNQNSVAGVPWSSVSGTYTWDSIPGTWNDYTASSTLVNRTIYCGSSQGTMYYLNSMATGDDGVAVTSRWRTGGMGGDRFGPTKTVTQVRVDYIADSGSSLTVRSSVDNGSRWVDGQRMSLPQASYASQAVVHLYAADRYPQIEISSEDRGYRVARFEVQMREGGR